MATIHYLALSAPCRVAHVAALAAGISVTLKPVDLLKGEHKGEAYLKINPKHQVPAVTEGDVVVRDSSAILRYFSIKNPNPAYPVNDAAALAPIDSVYESIRNDMFGTCNSLAFESVIVSKIFKARDSDPKRVKELTDKLSSELAFYEKNYFKDSGFLVGKAASIADYTMCISLAQATSFGYKVALPTKVGALFETIKKDPVYEKAHEDFFAFAANFQ